MRIDGVTRARSGLAKEAWRPRRQVLWLRWRRARQAARARRLAKRRMRCGLV